MARQGDIDKVKTKSVITTRQVMLESGQDHQKYVFCTNKFAFSV